MEKHLLSLSKLKICLLPCTASFLRRELILEKDETSLLTAASKKRDHGHEISKSLSRHNRITKLLERRLYEPDEQTEFITLGVAAVISIDGKEDIYLIDSICEGRGNKIISLHSPLGEKLFRLKKGAEGSYKVNEKDVNFKDFKILKIYPYSKAKELFYQEKVKTPTEKETQKTVNA